jgi:hypothetical protein
MKVVTTYNVNYEGLFEQFKNSMGSKNIEIFSKRLEGTVKAKRVFGTEEWYSCLKGKVSFLLENMQKYPRTNICLSDVDIKCYNTKRLEQDFELFSSSRFDFRACLESLHKPIPRPGSKSKRKINTGFIFIKNNSKMKKFIEGWLKLNFKKYKFGDQDAFNLLLMRSDLVRSYFNPNKYVLAHHKLPLTKGTVIFHATSSYSLQEKIDKINRFEGLTKEQGLHQLDID